MQKVEAAAAFLSTWEDENDRLWLPLCAQTVSLHRNCVRKHAIHTLGQYPYVLRDPKGKIGAQVP